MSLELGDWISPDRTKREFRKIQTKSIRSINGVCTENLAIKIPNEEFRQTQDHHKNIKSEQQVQSLFVAINKHGIRFRKKSSWNKVRNKIITYQSIVAYNSS